MTTTMSGVSNGGASQGDDSKYMAHNVVMKFVVSMALKSVLQLGIPDILANAEGKRPLSAVEILALLPTKSPPGPNSSSNLRRLLSPLVREGVFSETLNGDKQPVYGLTEVSKWFIKDSNTNMTPIADHQLHPVLLGGCWERMHELILDETTVPFINATGLTFWEYNTKDPQFGAGFQSAMVSYSQVCRSSEIVDNIRQCGALEGVNTLVDVGGGWGTIVAEVVAQNPHIQGVNFDMPKVIGTAPAIHGVRHEAGSFFEVIPPGDAMFLKWILHDHSDTDAIRILESCFKALSQSGKIIIAEYVLNKQENSTRATFKESMDLIMLSHFKGGRERTQEEYQGLLLKAGFSGSQVYWNPGSYDFIVGLKE